MSVLLKRVQYGRAFSSVIGVRRVEVPLLELVIHWHVDEDDRDAGVRVSA